jgi:hypothetical protein
MLVLDLYLYLMDAEMRRIFLYPAVESRPMSAYLHVY